MSTANNENSSPDSLKKDLQQLTRENQMLADKKGEAVDYIRQKIDQLLAVIGTVPLSPDELDDETLLHLDPIGIISDTFQQILDHQKESNIDLESARNDIQAIFDSVGEGILVLNKRGEIINFNRKMRNLFVEHVPGVLGETCRRAVCNGETSEDACLFNQVMARRKSVRTRSWECRSRFYEIIGTPVFDNNDEIQRIVILYMDRTKRRETELALQESEDRFRDLFENATDMLQSAAPDGTLLVVNKAWRETLGYEDHEIEGLNVFDIIRADQVDHCRKNLEKILEDGQEFSCQSIFLTKQGMEINVEGKINCRFVNGKPVALRGVFHDISDKLRLEEELRRTQKLEAVGLLAGGIAHDFNNLLTGIIGNIMMAKLKAPGGELTELLQNTENASYRAQELTRQLLTFAKGGAPIKETASVVDIIKDVTSFVLSGSNSNWTLETDGNVSPVEVDTGQFSQVLQNLIINSNQAMPDGGLITIRVSDCMIDAQNTITLPGGKYVRIEIRDQGIGIGTEYLPRIFDPYFTTKRKGSGLGLATAYSIIRHHNGLITAESEPGSSTTMTIYLPASEHEIHHKESSADLPIEGRGKVLVMDDDDIVRKVAVQMLTHLGYEVGESCDGEEALQSYRSAMEEGRAYDVIILDLTVPGKMGGKETIRRLLEIDPDVKAIVSSGYSNDPIMSEFQNYGFSGVVPKPYSLEQLGSTVHSLVAAASLP